MNNSGNLITEYNTFAGMTQLFYKFKPYDLCPSGEAC